MRINPHRIEQNTKADPTDYSSLRVVVINDFCHVNGGAAAVAIDAAIGLASAGAKVLYLGAVGPVDPRLQRASNLEVFCAGWETFLFAPGRIRPVLEGIWSARAAEFIERVIKSSGVIPEIAHVHGWLKAWSPSVFPALRACCVSTVVTLHDYFISCPNGGFIDHKNEQICTLDPLSWRCVARNCDSRSYTHKLWRVARASLQAAIVRHRSMIDGFIGVSEFSLQKMRSAIPKDAATVVIRNPVIDSSPQALWQGADGPILYVGRLSREKGAELVLKAGRKLNRRVVVAGDGPLRDALMRDYPAAQFMGWVDKDRIYELMTTSCCVVFPSLWYETNGLVVLEAMAHGVPVVVADGTAAAVNVKHGTTGFLFEMGNLDSLIAVLHEVVSQKGIDIGRQGAEWYWSDPWTLQKHVDGLQNFYEQVLRRKRSYGR